MPTIKIYSTPNCVYCKKAKDFFKSHDLSYVEVNVAEDAVAREEMFRKTGKMSVPVIEVNDKVVVGFSESAIRELLTSKSPVAAFSDPAEDNLCDSCQ